MLLLTNLVTQKNQVCLFSEINVGVNGNLWSEPLSSDSTRIEIPESSDINMHGNSISWQADTEDDECSAYVENVYQCNVMNIQLI